MGSRFFLLGFGFHNNTARSHKPTVQGGQPEEMAEGYRIERLFGSCSIPSLASFLSPVTFN
jgi:hypothetical protein